MLPSWLQPWVHVCCEVGGRIGVDPALLLALIDRESLGGQALTPKGPAGTGDHGHGHGLGQIHDRANGAHADFLARKEADGTPSWQVPQKNITYTAQLLRNLIRATGTEATALCGYNAGLRRAQEALNNCGSHDIEVVVKALDQVTTGKDYVSDVLKRRARYRADVVSIQQEKAP